MAPSESPSDSSESEEEHNESSEEESELPELLGVGDFRTLFLD